MIYLIDFFRRYHRKITAVFFLIYFVFWWFYKLDVLPGLHGDEAWCALKAYDQKSMSLDRLSGMTYYTGILQTLVAELSFNFFGIGVYQLRLPSAIVNSVALVVLLAAFHSIKKHKEALLFLLLMGSSALYLMSPRIAWEVNTFTLLFIGLSFSSVVAIYKWGNNKTCFWVILFWITNILGTYNHIIFSCLSVAEFAGLMLWATQKGTKVNSYYLGIAIINFANVLVVFYLQRYNMSWVFIHLNYLPFFFILALAIEYFALLKMEGINFHVDFLSRTITLIFVFISFFCFVYFHGRGFLDVVSEYKFILQTYSYESSSLFEAVFVAGALVVIFIFAIVLCKDLMGQTSLSSLPSYIIACYLGLFNLYTDKDSLRYYLVLYAIMAIYLSIKLSSFNQLRKIAAIASIIMLLAINLCFLDIFINDPIKVRAVDFKIGNGQDETSSAFLPKQPLIKFLRDNHVSKVEYLCYPYFIEEPLKFYKLISPWTEMSKDSAAVDYDYSKYRDGFLMIKTSKK